MFWDRYSKKTNSYEPCLGWVALETQEVDRVALRRLRATEEFPHLLTLLGLERDRLVREMLSTKPPRNRDEMAAEVRTIDKLYALLDVELEMLDKKEEET
jgi:hypothetical protein